jgi:hypothetical protein
MIEIRKIITMREAIFSELGVAASRPTIRAVGMAVIRNPFAGKFVEDLTALFEAGAMLGERLMPDLVKLLDGPAVSYGKGAIVGVAGEMEHGGACVARRALHVIILRFLRDRAARPAPRARRNAISLKPD